MKTHLTTLISIGLACASVLGWASERYPSRPVTLISPIAAGAGVDVLSVEPPKDGNPLLGAKNCLVTPHVAWAIREARLRLIDACAANVKAFLAGSPVNVVNP